VPYQRQLHRQSGHSYSFIRLDLQSINMIIQEMYKKSLCLILIMVVVVLVSLGTATTILYSVSFDGERHRLTETAQSQARLIEAIARFDMTHSGAHAFENTLSQLIEAHGNFEGFGETGEFTLAKREDNQIVFLLSHRHHDLANLNPIPFDGKKAAPMRLALQGNSGSLTGLDYRGEMVLAAYEPVAELNLGIVAKIDLKEIRSPFIRAAWITSGITIFFVLLGSWAFQRITKPMARQIEKSEKLFRDTFEHAAIGLAHVAPDGSWLQVNQALCDIMGYTNKELLQMNFQDITHPEDLHVDLHQMEQVLAGEIDSHSLKKRYIRKDGSTVPTVLTYSLVHNNAGQPDYFISAIKDITELERVKEELYDKSERLEIAINGTSDGLWLWDIKTDYEWHAHQWKRLLGYDGDEPLPKKYGTWESRIHPDDKERVLESLKRHLEENTRYDCKYRLRTKTGEYKWFRDRGMALKDDSDNPFRMGGSIQDINDLKIAENKLKKSNKEAELAKEFIDNALDAQKDTFFLLDPVAGKAIRWNKAFRETSGYSDDEIAELPAPTHYYSPEDLEKARKATTAVLEGKPVILEMELICKDGHKVSTEYQASLIADETAKYKYLVAIGRDITKRKRAEHDLLMLNNELKILSFKDGLTNLSNRRIFDQMLPKEWNHAQRDQTPLSLIMIDIDYFKNYNDYYGHLQGDGCLRQVAQAIDAVPKRATDIVARYGGEEFVILLPDTNAEQAIIVAEKCLEIVTQQQIPHAVSKVSNVVSISIGVNTMMPTQNLHPSALIKAADTLLYQAKENGRNQIQHN
jgi:diguanylate cyclase (GGDEF)-like protein/PAS domain S-box-containing protein